ncbi:MAG: FlgD immunoglobulin-like domain containing protein, partial [Candidatus Cloacimonadaceae bacterium]
TVDLLINDLEPMTFRLWGGGAEFTVVSDEGILEIGQSSTTEITVLNISNTSLSDVSVKVVSRTDAAVISDEPIHLGAIAAGETASFNIPVQVGAEAWGGRSLPITLFFSDNDYTTFCYYSLTAGVASNTSPTGPCPYGYYAYDSFDVGFAETPVYEWVEIDPNLGGHAEVFLHPDDASTTIDLPFTFRFYGKDYDQFTVCTNGWISLGDVDDVDFYNVYIPAALGPAPLIAPYWDDLKGIRIGEDDDGVPIFQDMRMLYWHDEANNRYIIQWNDAYNQYNLTSLEKFQIFLYPKDGDDGDIVFQYHTVDNPGITTNYCTVGIEDHTSTVGLTYTHANHYPPTATPLQAGLAIKFTTTPPDNYVGNDDYLLTPSVALEQNYPNPFNPSTTIRFNLDRGQKARLDIFNLKGQLVNTLVDENLEQGTHSIVFDGTDSKGNPLASGLYLYRLQTQNQSISRKMLLIK